MSSLVHAAFRARASGAGWTTRVIDTLLTWQERSRQRRDLARLPDHLLKDIGLSAADVAAEVSKPAWRR